MLPWRRIFIAVSAADEVRSEMDWGHLQTAYREHGIVLVLGAGVSYDSGLPNWPGLLERVADSLGDREGLFGDLQRSGIPLEVVASILQEECRRRSSGSSRSGRGKFIDDVRAALYQEFPFFSVGVAKTNRRKFVRNVRTSNTTLRAVASLCARRKREDRTYAPNPRVRAVVTFNLDGVLQAYVYARYEKRLLRTVERASAQAFTGRINVYHMHGFLRFDRWVNDPAKEAPDAVVLTEQDYFNFFGDPTSLFNYTFLYLLREWPCLFVGLSMRDENIRRLLHVSTTERVRGMKNAGWKRDRIDREALRHFAILRRSDASRSDDADRAFEASLRPLGTSVLWIDDYAEIPSQFREMYEAVDSDEAADSDWDLVY
jgi:hypothetical protein